jgi:hypothetical protein
MWLYLARKAWARTLVGPLPPLWDGHQVSPGISASALRFLLIRQMGEDGSGGTVDRTRDGILGHQFDKRLEAFAPCYSPVPSTGSLADFKENHTVITVILEERPDPPGSFHFSQCTEFLQIWSWAL